MKTRPIRGDEAELVRWLVSLLPADRQPALSTQIDALQVAERCDCGCPSVEFHVEGQAGTAAIVAEAAGCAPNGAPVEVLLWARSGHIAGLEVYTMDERESGLLPRPAELRRATITGTL